MCSEEKIEHLIDTLEKQELDVSICNATHRLAIILIKQFFQCFYIVFIISIN